jgi:uncharacterized membrane-anchored protein
MKSLPVLLAIAAAFVLPATLAAQTATPQADESAARAERILAQLHPVSGDVPIPGSGAILHLGHDYYFLPANEARLVLTEGWGNPPAQAEGVLGMVFPAGRTFADDTWGAAITYEATGYVSDSDAASADYGAMMTEMQSGESALNAERARQGFPARHLIGWAQTPTYDAGTHSIVWARNIQFENMAENTLNYDIRMLGRRGVLSLNMVTLMSGLAETRAAAQRFASAAEFTPGERYADYRSGDQVAEYGVAGLIAAGVGASIAQKSGVLALILAFGKKAIFFVVAGIALLWTRIRRLFGGRKEEDLAT